ncbi:MAG: hypothetical protein JRN52_07485 [Nitrososphaerota archaeon]|nr:hypothetical protein [Nitrososphaerota archaeon]
MPLHCPFCHAPEDERLDAVDEKGEGTLLVMFDCPFFFKFPTSARGTDESMQRLLDAWRSEDGESWLNSVGPVMKARELRNIERYQESIKKQPLTEN